MGIRQALCPLASILAVLPAAAQDPLQAILKSELGREMAILGQRGKAPYFLAYRVDETHRVNLSASFGALTHDSMTFDRMLNVVVRAGSPELDSTRELRGAWGNDFMASPPFAVSLPVEDDPVALRTAIWKATDRRCREAMDRLAKVRTNEAVKVAAEDKSMDFSREDHPNVFREPAPSRADLEVDKQAWIETLKAVSAVFREDPQVLGGHASFTLAFTREYFVSTEGTDVVQNHGSAHVRIDAMVKADDGMELPLYVTRFAFSPSGLPGRDALEAEARTLLGKLKILRNAPVVEPFNGPALLSGAAAGVFFHEIFGHRVEGHRQKKEDEGQTFKKKVNEKLLPESLAVISDPERKTYGPCDLNGHYLFDDEGVKGQRTDIVTHGVLKGFLMNRTPIEGFDRSNGHGRAQMGFRTVARQSNLIVETTSPVPRARLREHLLAECRAQKKPYGLLFQNVTGGFALTGRVIPNAFNVLPTEVYRVYVDGRPDEMVRGADLVGTPLMVFSNITEAGDDPEVFTGFCGAESGTVPVSCVAPSLLIRQIEVQKKYKSKDRPPILPRPTVEGGK
jgi:predicted Zn-dependent protease